MAIFVKDFLDDFMNDPELGSHIKDPSKRESLEAKMFQFFKFQMNGSDAYNGRPLSEVHKNFGISNELFDKASEKIMRAFKKQKPKLPVLREFIKRVSALREEICSPPKQEVEV